jgi:hypothetical protein
MLIHKCIVFTHLGMYLYIVGLELKLIGPEIKILGTTEIIPKILA